MVKNKCVQVIKISLLLVISFVLMVGCGGNQYKTIDVQEAYDLMKKDNYVMIDVRTPEEYAEGHVPGSVNIPVDDVEARLDELDKNVNYLMMCRVGVRSERASKIMIDNGFSKVFNIEGGMIEWPYEIEEGTLPTS